MGVGVKQIQYAYVQLRHYTHQNDGQVLFHPLSSDLQEKIYHSFNEAFDILGKEQWHIVGGMIDWVIFIEREIDKPKPIEQRFNEVFDA